MEDFSFSPSHGRRPPVPPASPTMLPRDVSIRSRSSSESSPSNPTVASKTWAEDLEEKVEIEFEADDQEEHRERLGPLPITPPRRSPSPSPPPVTPLTKCDVDHDPYYYDNYHYTLLGSNSDYDNDFLSKPDPTLRSRLLGSSYYDRYGCTTTTITTTKGSSSQGSSDGLFPRSYRYPWYYLYYDLSKPFCPSLYSRSDTDFDTDSKMFSLRHNPRTFLRIIVGLAFLMCFLTNMVSGGPFKAQHLRDAFHHWPWTTHIHQDLRRDDTAQGQSPQGAGGGGVIRIAASPALIDPQGVYIRASPFFSSDGVPDTSRIIAGYAATDGPDRVLRVSLSVNSGASWSFLGEVTRLPSDDLSDLDNAMPLALPSGRILLAFRHHSLSPLSSSSTGFAYTQYRLDVCVSDDGGHTWSFLSHIDERPTSGDPNNLNGLWEPFLRLASDGRTIQAYYSSENSASDQDNLMRFSTDEGRTWSDPPILVSSSSSANSRDGMTGVSLVSSDKCRNKELICVFETTTPSGIFSIASIFSSDDGLTWGQRQTVYTAAENKWAGAPQVYLVGDTLVVSFLTNEGTSLEKIDGAYTKVVTSKDGGRNWTGTGKAQTVAGTGSHWPGLFSLNETQFLALYSTDEKGAVGHLMSVAEEEAEGR